jgi:hypothetical protein
MTRPWYDENEPHPHEIHRWEDEGGGLHPNERVRPQGRFGGDWQSRLARAGCVLALVVVAFILVTFCLGW